MFFFLGGHEEAHVFDFEVHGWGEIGGGFNYGIFHPDPWTDDPK